MKSFIYQSGETIRPDDQITYHGEPGKVAFVVSDKVGDSAMDWYLDKYPGGGLMIEARSSGNVFLTENEINEDLVFMSRGE